MGRLGRMVFYLVLVSSRSLAQQYLISTFAGGTAPPTPVLAVNTGIGSPVGIATDTSGNVYFTSMNCVFKLNQTGVLTRLAGTPVRTTRATEGLPSQLN